MTKNNFVRRYVRPLIPFPKRKTLLRYFPSFETRNIGYIFKQNEINTVIDFGANRGQFALRLRSAGYAGRIVSFEPNRLVHSELSKIASRDSSWTVVEPIALGPASGTGTLLIPTDSSLASLLPSLHADAERSQPIEIRRLDDAVSELRFPPEAKIALKIDVQGYEMGVLEGAPETLEKARAILIEVCLKPTYIGEVDYLDILNVLKEKGFRAVDFYPVVRRRHLGEAYQTDVLLVRNNVDHAHGP